MLEVRLLGTFDLKYKKKPINISSRPAQSLFAYLILNARTSHRREKLAGLLWPDSLEETARDNLRHALWRVRKLLQAESSAHYLQVDDASIAFNASAEYWMDAAELEKFSERASADELIAILSEYQGELLPGFYDKWVVLEREHLHSIFEHHMARLMSLLQNEKRWLDILDWGERWIRLGQKPEPAYRALMSAHAAIGEMSKVAATYERCLKSLREFGMEPSEQTRALYERLKAGKEKLETAPTIPVPLGEERKQSPKTNLPVPLTSFIGREREIEEAKYLLSSTRLLTLMGTGGIGKTRLAIQAAKDLTTSYKDGIWWVQLASVIDDRLVPQAIAQVFGVLESPRQSLTESLENLLREKQLLLILDNCEHLIVACAQLVDDLLIHCENLRILTTSREALGITGETTMHIPTLSFPVLVDLSQLQNLKEFESIQLFIERAAAIHPDLALTQKNAFAVTQICHRLDGIPLALELAAARVKILSLEEIARRLDDRFNLLTQGSRTALPRHQTLRAAIDWSHDLLTGPERNFFRRLAVFAGGFTLETAEAVAAEGDVMKSQVTDLLGQLINKSLVTVAALTENFETKTRYRMLETIREYAHEKLEEAGEEAEVHNWHLAFFLTLAERADQEIHGPDQVNWINRLEIEHNNFRAALDWSISSGQTEPSLRLFGALGWFRHVRGFLDEARSGFHKIHVQLNLDNYPLAYAKVLNAIGRIAWHQGDYPFAQAILNKSQKICQALGSEGERDLAESFDLLGMVARWGERDIKTAQAFFEQGIALYRKCGDRWGEAKSLFHLGIVAKDEHYDVLALSLFEQSLAMFRKLGDLWGPGRVSENLGHLLLDQDENERARSIFEQALMTDQQLQFKEGIVSDLGDLGEVYYREGNIDQAVAFFEESLSLSREYDLKIDAAVALYSLGLIALDQDEYLKATQHFTDYFDVYHTIDEKWSTVDLLSGLAAVAAGTNRAERAAKLIGAAQGFHENVDGFQSPMDQEQIVSHISIAREQLGEAVFGALIAEGRTMTLEQAIKFALNELG